MKILYIEDSPGDSDLTKRELDANSPETQLDIVNTVQEAVIRLQNPRDYDLVLIDMLLPDGDGLDLLADIRRQNLPLAVVLITGQGDEASAVAALKGGADDYIIKKENYLSRLSITLENALHHFQGINNLRSHPLKVLYVERNKIDIDLTRRHFRQHAVNIRLTTVKTAEEAQDKLGSDEWDVLLLDYQLPGINALELIKIIRQEHQSEIPIVLVTGQGDEDIALQALKLGASDYVNKSAGYLFKLPGLLENAYAQAQFNKKQRELVQSEERFRLLADYTYDWEYWMNPDGTYAYISPSVERITGYRAEEFISTPDLLYEIIYPDYVERIRAHIQEEQDIDQPVMTLEFPIIHRSGEMVWLAHYCTSIFDVHGKYLGRRGNNRDITKRKQLEQQLHLQATAVKSAANAIVITDRDGNIEWINPAYSQLTGYTFEEVKNQNPRILKSNVQDDAFYKNLWDTILSGQVWRSELVNKRKDGSLYTEEETITPLMDPDETITHFIGIKHDITERKQMALALEKERNLLARRVEMRTEELRLANTELLRVLQTKDEFLANMSHELRTPLTSILGLSELLEMGVRGPLNPEQTDSIRTIYQSGEHLLTLINDILDLSKIEAGKLEIEPGFVHVDDICQSSLSLVQGLAYNKSLTISYHLSDPELTIWADLRRLKQILVNLLSNAVKFTPEGGHINLIIDLLSEQQCVRFVVEDNGIGISPENMHRLFEPFTQLDASLSRQYEGSGLGLALVRKLVELHHGKVFGESEGISGKGSRFTVILPWKDSPILESASSSGTSKPKEPDQQKSGSEQQPGTANQPLILLVEDNLSNITILNDYLQSFDYQVIEALNGKEALEKADEFEPDLILMDIQMPVMDGLEAMRCLRQDARFAQTPILALTALAMTGDLERCLEAGASDYVPKPVKMKELLSKISTWLEKRNA